MPAHVYPVDWRDEFAQLAPYLNGQGGIVRIRYAGRCCAPSAFLDAVKSEYECKDNDQIWRSIRIDHQVYSVRYLSGIREEFVRKIGLELPEAHVLVGAPVSFNVLTDVQASGDVHAQVSNVEQNIFFDHDDPAYMYRNRSHWITDLSSQLQEFLSEGHMMVVINHGSADDQDEFWRYMWEDSLEALIDAGLLLVHMVDTSDGSARIHDLAPAEHLAMNLPTTLNLDAQNDAIEDLTAIFLKEFPSTAREEARVRADTLVRTHFEDIPRLHRQYSALLMQMAQQSS